MTQTYGELYRCADFLQSAVQQGMIAEDFGKLLEFLKDLDECQREESKFFAQVRAGGASGGIGFHTRDQREDFMLLPRKGWLKVSTYSNGRRIQSHFNGAVENGRAEAMESSEAAHNAWCVEFDALDLILDFLEKLDPFEEEAEGNSRSEPRYFPHPVKQAALNLFLIGGRICPGADGKSPHEVRNASDFEFDHRHSYSNGGVSKACNIQVLCKACNRKKGDSSWIGKKEQVR